MFPGYDLVRDVIVGLLIAAVSSYITVQLSLRQFYSQRWWERKAKTYSMIIDAFYYQIYSTERYMGYEELGKTLADDRKAELDSISRKGWNVIHKATSIGEFIISQETAKQLEECDKELKVIDLKSNKQSLYEIMDQELDIYNKYIKIIRDCAKRDLKIKVSK
jgi:hypothetical protein